MEGRESKMTKLAQFSKERLTLEIGIKVSQDYEGLETAERAVEITKLWRDRIMSTVFHIPLPYGVNSIMRQPNSIKAKVRIFDYEGGPSVEFEVQL